MKRMLSRVALAFRPDGGPPTDVVLQCSDVRQEDPHRDSGLVMLDVSGAESCSEDEGRPVEAEDVDEWLLEELDAVGEDMTVGGDADRIGDMTCESSTAAVVEGADDDDEFLGNALIESGVHSELDHQVSLECAGQEHGPRAPLPDLRRAGDVSRRRRSRKLARRRTFCQSSCEGSGPAGDDAADDDLSRGERASLVPDAQLQEPAVCDPQTGLPSTAASGVPDQSEQDGSAVLRSAGGIAADPVVHLLGGASSDRCHVDDPVPHRRCCPLSDTDLMTIVSSQEPADGDPCISLQQRAGRIEELRADPAFCAQPSQRQPRRADVVDWSRVSSIHEETAAFSSSTARATNDPVRSICNDPVHSICNDPVHSICNDPVHSVHDNPLYSLSDAGDEKASDTASYVSVSDTSSTADTSETASTASASGTGAPSAATASSASACDTASTTEASDTASSASACNTASTTEACDTASSISASDAVSSAAAVSPPVAGREGRRLSTGGMSSHHSSQRQRPPLVRSATLQADSLMLLLISRTDGSHSDDRLPLLRGGQVGSGQLSGKDSQPPNSCISTGNPELGDSDNKQSPVSDVGGASSDASCCSRDASDSGYGRPASDARCDQRTSAEQLSGQLSHTAADSRQLFQERQILQYQVELLKDQLEELYEEHRSQQRVQRNQTSEHQLLKRTSCQLEQKLQLCSTQLAERHALLQSHGLVMVGGDTGQMVRGEAATLISNQSAGLLKTAGVGTLESRMRRLAAERNSLEDDICRTRAELEEERERNAQHRANSLHPADIKREVDKLKVAYTQKLKKSEQELAALQTSVQRLERQVHKYKMAAQEAECNEDELKAEKRKLTRRLKDSLAKSEDLDRSNKLLNKRMEKFNSVKSSILKDLTSQSSVTDESM